MTTDIIDPEGGPAAFRERAEEFGWDTLLVVGDDVAVASDKDDLNSLAGEYGVLLADGRWGFDDTRVDGVFNLEDSDRDDHTHYRRSGMTQVHAKRAVANGICVVFNLRLLFGERREVHMGRMMQNVRICQKYEVPMRIVSMAEKPVQMRHAKDVEAVGRVLGMPDRQASAAVQW